jgi:hypothetical protein
MFFGSMPLLALSADKIFISYQVFRLLRLNNLLILRVIFHEIQRYFSKSVNAGLDGGFSSISCTQQPRSKAEQRDRQNSLKLFKVFC